MSLSPESSIRSLEEQAKSINSSYTKNTDLIGKGVDNLVGVFGGETVDKIYTDQILGIQKQAKSLLSKLHIEILTEEQRIRLERLKDGKLEDVGIVQMTKNTDLKQAVVNGVYGVKGEITGTLHGLKVMITGVFDLAVFMGKYAGSILGIHPEYKTKINEQATQLFDWMKKEGRVGIQDKVFELIEQEMTRISTLPQEEQAEAIGNIAGNIIGMLTGIKAGITLASKSGEMAGKVAQVARITEKIAKRATVNTTRMNHVGNLGKQAGYIRMGATVAEKTLNGVAESLIGYGFAKGLSVTWELIRNSTVSVSKKLSSIEKTIIEMEGTLKTETNTTQQQVIQEEIQKLREEKVKIQRPDQNLDELRVNAGLSQDTRIQKVRELLETPMRKLTKEQINMIIHIHENISKGVFNNDYATLKMMTKELKKVGLDEKDTRTLIENGILGSLEGGSKWGMDSTGIKNAERRIEGREGYSHQEPLEQPKQAIPMSQKIANMNRRIGELEQSLMEIDDPYLLRANKKQIALLRQEKVRLERSGKDIQHININSGLSNEARLTKASELLGGKDLIEEQKRAILHIHNNISKGVFQNGYSELRQMTNELKKVGFSKDEIRKLMENGILGNTNDTLSNLRQSRLNQSELILENAKQVGARLFVLGEDIMRQNPNLTGAELKELILRKASENNMKVSGYQHRVLDRQVEIYDSLKLKRDEKIKGWFDKAGISIPKDHKEIEELINSNKKLNFIVWKSIFGDLYEKNRSRIVGLLSSPQMEYVNINMQGDAGKISQELAAREVKKGLTKDSLLGLTHKDDLLNKLESMPQIEIEEILYDIYIIQKGIEVNITTHSPMIDITGGEFDINSYGGGYHGTRLGVFEHGNIFGMNTRSNKGHFQTEAEYIKNINEGKKTSEHEYQHSLNYHFLNPDMLASVFNKDLSFSQKRIGRDIGILNPIEYQRRIWKSMQDELCSYLERNNYLPHNIDSYLDNFLQSEKSQISSNLISEMQDAVLFFNRLFNLPVEELRGKGKEIIGIIRTSYSIQDMLTRLQKKFPTLKNNL